MKWRQILYKCIMGLYLIYCALDLVLLLDSLFLFDMYNKYLSTNSTNNAIIGIGFFLYALAFALLLLHITRFIRVRYPLIFVSLLHILIMTINGYLEVRKNGW